MQLADSRQGYGWISIAFHWVVAIATFYLLYNGMTLEGDGGEREGSARGEGVGRAAESGGRLADGARQFGEGVASAGRQFVENVFAPRSLHISIGVIAIVASIWVGAGRRPSIPVKSDSETVPGWTSQRRLTASDWKLLIQPASWAVWAAVASRPAATKTRTRPVILKNFARLMWTPPL